MGRPQRHILEGNVLLKQQERKRKEETWLRTWKQLFVQRRRSWLDITLMIYIRIFVNTNFSYMTYTIKKLSMHYFDYGLGFTKEVKKQASSFPDN